MITPAETAFFWKEVEEIIIIRRTTERVLVQPYNVIEWQGTTSVPIQLIVPGPPITLPRPTP